MAIQSWPKLVIKWENSDIGWAWNWYRIPTYDHRDPRCNCVEAPLCGGRDRVCRRHGRWVRYLDAGLHRPAHLEEWALHPQTVERYLPVLRRRSVGRHGNRHCSRSIRPQDHVARVARARRSIHHALRSVRQSRAIDGASRAGPALVWAERCQPPSRWLPRMLQFINAAQ